MKKTNNNELFAPEAYVAPSAKVYMVQLRTRILEDSGEWLDSSDVDGTNDLGNI